MIEITPKLHQFIQDKLGVEESAITANASFYDNLDVDSLDFYELIADLEKAFDVVIPDDEYHKLRTVGALERYISKLVNEKNSGLQSPEEEMEFEERLSA